jgi:hypothetical protein
MGCMWSVFNWLRMGSNDHLLRLWCWKFGLNKGWRILTKWFSVIFLKCLINRFIEIGCCTWNSLDRVQQQILMVTNLPSVVPVWKFPTALWVARGVILGIKWITLSCFTLFGVWFVGNMHPIDALTSHMNVWCLQSQLVYLI